MALSSSPARPASKKRKPLSPARVYQAWAADVSQHGKRGSFRRTAELVGCTPEYIRQLVAKREAAHTVKPEFFTAHELDYMPAPGEIPLPRPAQPPTIATPQTSTAPADSCETYVKQDADVNVNSCETGETQQLATDKQPQPAERETVMLPLVDLPTALPQMSTPAASAPPAGSVKRYMARPAPRPAHARVVEHLRAHVNPYMLLALAAVALLVLAVQYVR